MFSILMYILSLILKSDKLKERQNSEDFQLSHYFNNINLNPIALFLRYGTWGMGDNYDKCIGSPLCVLTQRLLKQ